MEADGGMPDGYYYSANSICTAEHCGTHLDAPVYFARGQHTVDQRSGGVRLGLGDEVLISAMDYHFNIVPWQPGSSGWVARPLP